MMTMAEVRAAIGHERAAWVEAIATGELAILVRAARQGEGALIRYATPHGAYHWVDLKALRRREDLDDSREPVWLQQARMSPRPPAVLWDILNQTATKYAQTRTDEELQDDDAIRAPQFDTDADGRVL